jgi:hypothetical protein
MNYRLTNFEIKVAQGNHISGQESNGYLYCTAFNPMNRFEKSHNIVIFDKGMVEYYRQKLPASRGGLLPDDNWSEQNMDAQDKIFVNGCTVEYDLGGLYCRTYTADIVDANGNVVPGKEAGKIICDPNGNPIVFGKIPVFCQYSFKTEAVFDDFGMPVIDPTTGNSKVKVIRDETGKPIEQWVSGWSPAEVGESMRRLLTPYTSVQISASGAPANPAIEVPESPQVFGPAPQGGAAAPQNGTAPQGGAPAGAAAAGA